MLKNGSVARIIFINLIPVGVPRFTKGNSAHNIENLRFSRKFFKKCEIFQQMRVIKLYSLCSLPRLAERSAA